MGNNISQIFTEGLLYSRHCFNSLDTSVNKTEFCPSGAKFWWVGDKTISVTGKLYNMLKNNSVLENGDVEQGKWVSGVDVRIGKQ